MIKKSLFYIFITLSALTLSACGNSSSSGGGAVTTGPATPNNPGATTGDQRVTVTWNSAAGASSYNVYWSTNTGTGTGGTMVNVTASPYYHDGVTNATPYYYVITAVNGAGESSATAEVSATPNTIDISTLVFTDSNLATCVNTAATNAGWTVVNEMTTLTCDSMGINSIAGIEALTSLSTLSLRTNTITDVSALASLTSLTTLNLLTNTITDVSPLAGLTGLTYLNLSENTALTVMNINTLLPSLTSLTRLVLNSLGIDDAGLSTLAPNLTSLTTLILGGNTLTDIGPLAILTGLTYLDLSNNALTYVSPLASLTNLTQLYLQYNTIVDVSPLASLTNLTTLYLRNNSIGGQGVGNVDSLITLTSANGIYLTGNAGMSCNELTTLIMALLSPPVDTDTNLGTSETATPGTNCTNP